MEFFADGGFQQLFCDLNEQQYCESSIMWNDQGSLTPDYSDHNELNNNTEISEENYLYCDNDYYFVTMEAESEASNPNDLSEKHLQASLDYLLNNSYDLMDSISQHAELTLQAKELSDWEEKFLDNYIEIPELVEFLPEKTPLCTENCNHFLQESAENLKLFATPPSSPGSSCSSPTTSQTNSKLPSSAEYTKENDKIYTCNFGDCGKIYAKPAHLKAHLRRHLGEKPYVCTWSDCTWRFSRSDELARHRRSHSGVKPYKCDFCSKCFARSDHLTKHRKVHERRILAASKAGKLCLGGVMPQSVLTVRPGRKRKNQL
ncbi:Krueppel-like factor 9 [Musca vetustissima]|uniref:Krueppel-like factor 9 n=1 Tax=Musca vetustissima TaxID=27455 RepID=UPI002AB7CEF7|nr:Krueppel-like factor 9 [Musca vetustissima]